MTLLYFDTNAFVKLVIDEVGTDLAGEIWNAADAVVSSRLTVPETHAALAGTCAHDFALSGADAVHLASALVLRDAHVVMVSWDRRLNDAARAAGLRAVPAFS